MDGLMSELKSFYEELPNGNHVWIPCPKPSDDTIVTNEREETLIRTNCSVCKGVCTLGQRLRIFESEEHALPCFKCKQPFCFQWINGVTKPCMIRCMSEDIKCDRLY